MAEFRMPKLGADMEAGKLLAWRKAPGDAVAKGEILADIETDKAAFEVESFQAGVLERLLVAPGQKVPVGTPLAILRVPGEAPTAALPAPEQPALAQAAAAPVAPALPSPDAGHRHAASPAARRRARELGLDPEALAGTGPEGRVTREDVEAAAAARDRGPAEAGEARPRMRQAIAAAMARSKREIPHYYLALACDLGPASAWLAQANASRGVEDRLLLGALLLKATALALRDVPGLNGFWADGAFQPGTGVHLGVAVSLRGGGLIAPAILDADRLPLDALNRALADLVRRAREGGLRGSEMSEATATVTSLGDQGVDLLHGVIVPPQVALVGFGAVAERPWVVEGRVEARPVLTASLAADHRASDGHQGARFLRALEGHLRAPGAL